MKKNRLTAFVLVLCLLTVGMGVWAVSGTVRIAKLNARIAELENANVPAQVSVPAGVDLNAIAAEFNGGVVTVAEAMEEYSIVEEYYQMMGMTEAEYAENAKYTVLDGLVETKILENKAREAGVYELTKDQEEEIAARVKAEYEDNVRYYMEFRFDESKSEAQVREETVAYLDANGLSYDAMLETARKEAWKERLFEYVTRDLTISDEQMREFYESQVVSAEMSYSTNFMEYEMDSGAGRTMIWSPEGVRRIEYILVPFSAEQEVDFMVLQAEMETGDESARAKLDALYESLMPGAQEVLNRIQSGEDFNALMQEFSGEEIYVAQQSELLGADMRDAAMALANPGDISGLVPMDGGICILRYAGDVPAGPAAYEDVKDDLMETYASELKSSSYNTAVMQWITEADVKYYIDRF